MMKKVAVLIFVVALALPVAAHAQFVPTPPPQGDPGQGRPVPPGAERGPGGPGPSFHEFHGREHAFGPWWKDSEIAKQLAEGPPLLFPAIKQLLRHTEVVAEHAAFELHDALSAVQKVIRSEDLKEGARAFAEKRKPVWKGR